MSLKINTILLGILILSFFRLPAQPFSQIRDVDILADQRIVLHLDYPRQYDTLKIIRMKQISPKHTRISYIQHGIYCEAIINSDRKDMLLVASGVAIPEEEVPGPVLAAFEKSDYGDWKITGILAMRTPYESWFYAIDAEYGDTFLRLFYNELGAPVNAPY
jgi:hypothetical protein